MKCSTVEDAGRTRLRFDSTHPPRTRPAPAPHPPRTSRGKVPNASQKDVDATFPRGAAGLHFAHEGPVYTDESRWKIIDPFAPHKNDP
ncbi:MAG: hypothetical protein ACTSUE_24870 [Promethearchaeota archaeon]